jgi:hypothetical protein
MFIAALFTRASFGTSQPNEPEGSSSNEWIKNMWCICPLNYYSIIKNNEIMVFAGKWMELEVIMLSKVSQVQKKKGCMFFLM